jgi:hypothetical protein
MACFEHENLGVILHTMHEHLRVLFATLGKDVQGIVQLKERYLVRSIEESWRTPRTPTSQRHQAPSSH